MIRPGDRIEVTENPSGYTWTAKLGVRGTVTSLVETVLSTESPHWYVSLDDGTGDGKLVFDECELRKLSILELMAEAAACEDVQ